MPRPVTGRLAPSPTGALHVGNARTFLIAWLACRSAGGRMILRVEDIDASRARPEATTLALEDLRWLGLDWEEGPDVGGPHAPYLQSERLHLYRETLARLVAADLVYPCTCTRADIERAASAPHASDEGPTYPGTCSGRSAADARHLADRPFAWRFRVPTGVVTWDDLGLGRMGLDPSIVGGDFVVAKSSGVPSYQFAVSLDDALMRVNQVIRGDDLVPSTPRQILLHRALGYDPPAFGHVPLVVGADGRRLAKRDQSIKLARLHIAGVAPESLLGRLAESCGYPTGSFRDRLSDLIPAFDFRRIPSAPWAVSLAP